MKTKQDNDVTDCIGVVYLKTKLGYCDQSDWVRFVMKTTQDNSMTDRIGLVYVKTILNY